MLKIKVNDTCAAVDSGTDIPSGSVDERVVTFDLSEEWDGFTVTAQFSGNDSVKHIAGIVSGTEYKIPWECIKKGGSKSGRSFCPLEITVFGIKGDAVKTAIPTSVRIIDSGKSEATEPQTPTESVYDQIISSYNDCEKLSNKVTSMTDDAYEHLDDRYPTVGTMLSVIFDQFDCRVIDTINPQQTNNTYNIPLEGAIIKFVNSQIANAAIDTSVFANVIKNTVSGKAAAANDISSSDHALTVSLSSSTVTDFSSVSVKKYGKNLINGNHITTNGVTFPVNLSAGTYVISVRNSDGSATGITYGSTFSANFKDANNAVVKSVSGQGKFVLTAEDAARITKLATACSVTIPDGVYRMYQLECGSIATSFEPYVEPQTVTANADGTVTGLTFASPSITLMTDNSAVDISLTYNADTKKYIDNKLNKLSAAIVALGGTI